MSPAPPEHMQQTLRGTASCVGVGLFTASRVTATFRAAEAGTGIVFCRTDLEGSPRIPAMIQHVIDRPRRTALGKGEATVEMVEHCLSALMGMGIDNAIIEIDGPEMPAGDGSAMPYVEAIRTAGIVAQSQPRNPLVITEPLSLTDGEASIAVLPCETTDYLYVLDYGAKAPFFGRQMEQLKLSAERYAETIAPARTFSTEAEVRAMREHGLFRHLTPKDMLVIGEHGPIDNSYRFANEPARHKLLDLIGDLALIGRPIRGRVVAVQSGHALNQKMARALAAIAVPMGVPEAAADHPSSLDIRAVIKMLPHRFPMLMVDRVLLLEPGKRAVGIKNVTINEPIFQGHYPDAPIMPGVLIVEAMSQLSGLMLHGILEHEGKIGVLLSLDRVKLRKAVVPGDQLRLESEVIRASARYGEAQCRAFVGKDLVAEALLKFLMVEPSLGQ